jgi:thioredoxin-dependent peroxiredoxin
MNDIANIDAEIERTDEAYEFGMKLTVIGPKLEVGMPAPPFTLDMLTVDGSAIEEISLSQSDGKIRLLNVVNSLDTPVCHVETRRWDAQIAPTDDIVLYTISMDLPFAQGRWRSAEGVNHTLLSGHRSEAFGRDYGVLIKEWRMLQRAVFVIDRDGTIAHAEYVADQMAEPDYEKALMVVGRC